MDMHVKMHILALITCVNPICIGFAPALNHYLDLKRATYVKKGADDGTSGQKSGNSGGIIV